MDRRRFLHLGLGTLFTGSGLTALLAPRAHAAAHGLDLRAVAEPLALADGRSVPVWRFRQTLPGPGALGAGLVLREGEQVEIRLDNALDRPLRWVVPGVIEDTPRIPAGGRGRFTLTAPPPSSSYFSDGESPRLARAMGLAAPLVVLPAEGPVLAPGEPPYDRHYTLVLQEMDSRLNEAVGAGLPYDLADYAPDYFFVNGLAYPATRDDTDTLIRTAVGERVALRFINAGLIHYPMHFHGYHVRVINRDRRRELHVIDKDTVPVAPGETVDVLLHVDQAGTYPLHSHYVPAVTGGGIYPLGGLMFIEAA